MPGTDAAKSLWPVVSSASWNRETKRKRSGTIQPRLKNREPIYRARYVELYLRMEGMSHSTDNPKLLHPARLEHLCRPAWVSVAASAERMTAMSLEMEWVVQQQSQDEYLAVKTT